MVATSQTFDDLQRALVQSRAVTDAAEAHGTLVGSLCASHCSLGDWLAEILPEGRAENTAADSPARGIRIHCGCARRWRDVFRAAAADG